MKRSIKSVLNGLAMVLIAGSVVACSAKGTVTRKYNSDGKVQEETQHQKFELLPGVRLNPGQVLPQIPGIIIQTPSVPGELHPVTLPDGRPGVILPSDPNTVYPVKTSMVERSDGGKKAGYDVELNIDDNSFATTATLTQHGRNAPQLLQRDDAAWKGLQYSRNGDEESVFSKNPYIVAGFLYSRGFTDFGEFGHSIDFTVSNDQGQVLGIMPLGLGNNGGSTFIFPLINSETR